MHLSLYLFFWGKPVLADTLPKIEITLNEKKILVEVADEPHERGKGLMFRKEMPADQGMLFVYDKEEHRSFWMKNTYIALSIAYLDQNGKIVHIADMKPQDETSVPSIFPAQYALEMNQGWFEKYNVEVGMTVKLRDVTEEASRDTIIDEKNR